MKDEDKTKEQLLNELMEMRQRIAELETADTEHERAEKALRESEERYHSLFEGVPVGINLTTPEGQILDANPALVHLLGYPDRETLLAVNATDLYVAPEDRRRWQALIEREGVVRGFEVQLRRRDGTTVWVRSNARAICDADSRVLYYEGSLEDITERKRAEEGQHKALAGALQATHALRESEERYRTLYKAESSAIFLVDEDTGELIDANPAAERLYGYTRKELLQMKAWELSAEPEETKRVIRVYNTKGVAHVPLRYHKNKAGTVFTVEISASHCRIKDRNINISTIRDITERKRAEEALRESEERHRLLFQNAPIGIMSADATGHILAVNPALLRMLGSPSAEATREINILTFPLLVEVGFAADFLRCLEEEITIVSEHLYTSKWGKETYYKCHLTPIREASGQSTGLQAIIEDITERKRAEEALRRRAEELDVLQATVLDITAPHDLPTLLQTIVERATRLLDAPGGGLYLCDPDQQEVRCVVSYNTPHDYTGAVLKYGEGAAGTVAQTGEPLVIDDYRTWSGRAAVYEEEQPFTAVLNVPMIWQDQVTGMINVLHDVETRRFTQADLELLTLFANHAAIAVENARLYEKALQDAKTKSFLLDEVNHRVKNTLGAIIGLLHVEQSYAAMADHATYEAIIQNMTNRVSGLATVHSLLSASEWAPLPLSDLAGQVIKSATQMCPRDKQVFIDAPPSPVRVTPDQAHNLALVINELATNTIQHTLPGRSTARISVRVALEDDGLASHAVLFEYRDDGPGYPEDVLRLERHAVGFDLIKNLTRQSLRGELSLHNDEGAVAVIRFPAQA